MKINKIKLLTFVVAGFYSFSTLAQQVWIRTENFKQEFLGVGGTADGFVHTWNSQSDEAKQQALKLVAEDIHLNWIKNYPSGNLTGTTEFVNFAKFAEDIKTVNPDVKVHITVNNLPDELEQTNSDGENKKGEVDDSIQDVYLKVAQYYFNVLKLFQDQGVEVHELDLLNEPGGVDGAVRKGRLYSESVNHLRNMINDTSINTTGIKMPLIAGPSHWSVDGGKVWIDEWKEKLPEAISNLDILTTHGYRQGWDSGSYQALHDSLDLPFFNNEQTGKLQEDDPLTEAGFDSNAPDYISDISIAGRIIQAINGGVDAFFVFNLMNSSGNNAALIKTGSSINPEKSKIYTGFKQVTSLQPKNSHRLGRVTQGLNGSKVLAMRKVGDSKVYLHIVNTNEFSQNFAIHLSDDGTNDRYIHSAKVWVTDESFEESIRYEHSFESGLPTFEYSISPYSLTSFEFVFSDSPNSFSTPTPTPTPTPTATPSPSVTPTPSFTPQPGEVIKIEAESASSFTGDTRTYDDAAASGGLGVAYMDTVGEGFTLTDVPASHEINVYYASQNTGAMSMRVNGQEAGKISFTSNNVWVGSYEMVTVSVDIPSDASFEIYFGEGDASMNIDYIEFVASDDPSTPSPTPTPVGGWNEISFEDFEQGFVHWEDGGNDVFLRKNTEHASSGVNAANIQDDSGPKSTVRQLPFNATPYSQLEISFWYQPISMELDEFFRIQFETADGKWANLKDYVKGVDFVKNGDEYSATLTINASDYDFGNASRFRIRCFGNTNADDIYLDDISVRGFR